MINDCFACQTNLCCCYEQSKNQRGNRRDQAYTKSHDVFRVFVKVMFWQSAAKQRANQDAT